MDPVDSLNPLPSFPVLAPEAAQPKPSGVEQPGAQKDVAVQFASMLMSMVVKEMWKTTDLDGDGNGPFGSGPGADIYRGLAESSFADVLARNGMRSLTEQVEQYLGSNKRDPEIES